MMTQCHDDEFSMGGGEFEKGKRGRKRKEGGGKGKKKREKKRKGKKIAQNRY